MNELTENEIQNARDLLTRTRARSNQIDVAIASGVYAIYLRKSGLLSPFVEGFNGVIYVGISEGVSDRQLKQHFSTNGTGFSTVRRSIGAILKQQLQLNTVPRADGLSESNVRCYRFTEEGEKNLNNLMNEHLEVGLCASVRAEALERYLVKEWQPVLNLKLWENPHRSEIKRLRKLCADEARAARS